jgi:hypothetical protein
MLMVDRLPVTVAARGGRGNAQRDGAERHASAAQSHPGAPNNNATQVSELTDRGSQNGRGFGRGAYGNNNGA